MQSRVTRQVKVQQRRVTCRRVTRWRRVTAAANPSLAILAHVWAVWHTLWVI